MTDNELLLAISEMMDTKLDSKLSPIENRLERVENRLERVDNRLERVEDRLDGLENKFDELENRVESLENNDKRIEIRVKRIEIDLLENNVLPRLSTIESCYTDTYNRYKNHADQIQAVIEDNTLLKKVVTEHSEKLQAIC